MKKLIAIMTVIIIAICLLPASVSAEGKVTMQLDVNFRDHLHWQNWNRIEVQLDNKANDDFKGTVEVTVGGTYTQNVEIKKGEGTLVEFYLPPLGPENIYSGNVTLKDHNNRTVVSRSLETKQFDMNSDWLVGVTSNSSRFQRFSNIDQTLLTVDLKGEHFNNLLFLDNLTMLIIDNQFTINDTQRNNILKWVERGGTLVVEKGNTVFDAVLPDVDSIDNSLLIRNNYGRGNILLSTVPFGDQVFEDIVVLEEYLSQILAANKKSHGGDTARLEEARRFLGQLSSELARLKFLSPGILFIGLIFYIALIGPINFMVLRKLKKWDLGWITIPTIAIFFTIILFVIGSLGRSNVLNNNQMNFIEYHQNGTEVLSINSIFIPKSNVKDIEVSDGYIMPVTSGVTARENRIIDLGKSRIWSVERVMVSTQREISGPEISLNLYSDKAEIRISNFDIDVFDSYLFVGDGWYKVGEIKAGQSKVLGLRNPIHGINYEEIFNRYDLFWSFSQLIEGAGQGSNYVFVALDDSQEILDLNGVTTNKVLNVNVLRESVMDINIKEPGAIKGVEGYFAKINFDEYSSHYNYYYFFGKGQLEIHFDLPDLDYSDCSGEIDVSGMYSSNSIKAEAFNIESGAWDTIGFNQVISLPNLEQYSEGGRVKLRLTGDEMSQLEIATDYIKMSVKGGTTND